MEKKKQYRMKKINIVLLAVLLSVFASACNMKNGISQTPANPAQNQTDGSLGNGLSGDGGDAQGAGNSSANAGSDAALGTENDYGTGEVQQLETNASAGAENVLTEASQIVKESGGHGYYYEQLSETEKVWYEEIYAILFSMSGELILSAEGNVTVGADGLDKIFQCVMHDHPELFFVNGYTYTLYTYGEELAKIGFTGTYTMTAKEKEEMQKQIDAAVEECLSGIDMQASDYEKVKYVYEYVIYRTSYNQESAENQNICSVFIGKESVCQGYAKSVQYLLQKLDIPATLVIGKVHGTESHAWNLIQVDGEYYYLDATWGDASYTSQGEAAAVAVLPGISYDYLCVTTADMEKTHTIESPVTMPRCTAMSANYYVMEGAYFSSYDANALAALFDKGYDEDRVAVTLRCADETVYNTFMEELVTNQQIFNYLNSVDGRVAFAQDADKLSMTFWLVNE